MKIASLTTGLLLTLLFFVSPSLAGDIVGARCGFQADCNIGDANTKSITITTDSGVATHDGPNSIVHIGAGADPLATCTVGEIYIDLNTSADTNCVTTSNNSLCLCVATDTWAELDNN